MERDVFAAVRRQAWLVVAVVVIVVGGTAVISKALPKVYASSATLISLAGKETTFDSVQAGQFLARSYADIIDGPLFARLVAQRLGRPQDGGEIGEAMRFEPLTETQLLKITAEARDPEAARVLADTYARVFIEYSRQSLSEPTGARVALAVPAQATGQAIRPRPTLYVLLAALIAAPLALSLALWRDRVDGGRRTDTEGGRFKLSPSPATGDRQSRGAEGITR